MNIKKANGYVKLLVVFLVAIILIFAVGIVADGWQQNVTDTPSDNNGESADSDSGKADENKDPENEAQKDETTSDTVIPKYFNYLTGTQTDEALYLKRHKAFIFDSASPLYGISYSDVLIELPIEDGNTRFVSFINDYRGLGKIGALTASRDYISRVAQFFGGIIVSMGEDSSINNNTQNAYKEAIDLSEHKAHFYTEYNIFNYTNGSLFEGAVLSCGFQDNRKNDSTLPYVFADYESEKITLKNQVGSVKLQFSEKHSTELYFSSIENKYSLLKNGAVKTALLNSQI
jgi:hypothetical protein